MCSKYFVFSPVRSFLKCSLKPCAAILQQTGGKKSLVESCKARRFEKRFIKDISWRLVSNAETVRENFPKDENFT